MTQMMHAVFQDHGTFSSVDFKGLDHGGHLGHVTWTIIYILSIFLRRLHVKLCFDRPSGFQIIYLKIMLIHM